jgi:phenylalanyl-tRNA synthetase beta chain
MEAQGQTLVTSNAVVPLTEGEGIVPLANPLSSDMNVLRPSLLPGLLDALRHNTHHKNHNVALFEIGRAFGTKDGTTREHRRLAIALTGERNPSFWAGEDRHARFDSYDLKGMLEEFLEQFGLRGLTYTQQPGSTALFLESATIQLGRNAIGTLGQLLPALARQFDLRDAVLLAELDLDQLLARRNTSRSFKPLPQFPAIQRDVAMILPESTTHDAVLNVVKQAKPRNLENIELFDVFRGKNVPAGQKSVAYSFTYRAADRTLTDAEVNAAHEKLVEELKQRLQAVVRDSR